MDFALLPPEINSTLMYSGPGSGSLWVAAAAWQQLATELHNTASSYSSVISGMTAGPWIGPAAASMKAAVAPHLAWLNATAGQAEHAAAQAAAAAGAHETAFVGTVPPAEVEANRALLTTLVATNIFGQNTPTIAMVEGDYAEMWAQDAAVMYSYAGASSAASSLTPFSPPDPAVTPTALVDQAAAVAQAGGGIDTAETQSLQQLVSQLPATLLGLAGFTNSPPWLAHPAAALGLTGHTWTPNGDGIVLGGLLGGVVQGLTGSATVNAGTGFNTFIRLVSPMRLFTTAFRDIEGLTHSLIPATSKAVEGIAKAVEVLPQTMLGPSGVGNSLTGIGKAAQIGGLSVPNAWAADTAGLGRVATLPLSGAGAAAAIADPSHHMLSGIPLTGGLGRGLAAAAPRYGFHPTVMARPPFAG